MNQNVKVSVVIVSYNQDTFLERTIQSVVNQGYQNKEIVIIDDGSTDGSLDIIRKYEKHLHYWTSQVNSGQTKAISNGFAQCTGEIIGWINSDDLLGEGTLERVAKTAIKKNNVDAVFFGGALTIDADDRPQDRFYYGNFNSFIAKRIGPTLCQPGTFWGKKVYDKIGGLKTELRYGMDYDLFCNFLFSNTPFYYTGGINGEFRKYPSQKGHSTAYFEIVRTETDASNKRYGLDQFPKYQKGIALLLQTTLRIFNGYYWDKFFFRLKVRGSLKEFNTSYSTTAYKK